MVKHIVKAALGRYRAFALLRKVFRAAKTVPVERRLILITHELNRSGSSLLLANLCDYYASKGYALALLTENDQPVAEAIEPLIAGTGAPVRLNYRSGTRMRALRALRKHGFHRAIGNTIVSGTFARELHEAGIRGTFLIHEMWASLNIVNAVGMCRQVIRWADALVFPSATVRDSFLEFSEEACNPGKVFILPQGRRESAPVRVSREEAQASVRQTLGIGAEDRVLVGAGAINFGKGVDFWLPVLKELNGAEDGQPYHMLWLGAVDEKDPYYLWLRVQARAMGLERRIHFVGYIADGAQYSRLLEGSDAFFLSSREDAFPSVMIEAVSAGVPVLAYQGSGGGADYIAETGAGLCVPMGDARAAAAAARELCAHPGRYADAASVERAAQSFRFSDYADRLLELA